MKIATIAEERTDSMDDSFGKPLPVTDHLFGPATGPSSIIASGADPITKLDGTGDSGGKRSSRKAPGGKDASQQKDGG